MKKILTLLLTVLLLGSVFTSCTVGKIGRGTIKETENSGEKVFWKQETDAVRGELDAIFQSKYSETKAFAEIKASGTVYYISSKNGSNSNSGKSKSSAWKNCSMLESVSLKSGDTVVFECGSVFREQIEMKSGVTYSSYGDGAKPIFYGSINASGTSKWNAVSGIPNLYCYNGTIPYRNDIGNICFDGGKAWGIKIQKLDNANNTLELRNVSNGIQTFDKIPSYYFSSGTDLKNYHLSYYHDPSGKLYLWCEGGNPGSVFTSIELSQSVKIFNGADISNVEISNLDFRYCGQFAIRTLNAKKITIKNCSFFFIGGSIQFDYENSARNYKTRFGNAIENWNSVDGMTVENCYFNQIYDAAITTQSNSKMDMKNITYRGNVIKNAWFGIELWSGSADNTGCKFENVDISNNYFTDIGFGFTTQRPDKIESGVGVEGFIKVSRGAYAITNASVTDNIIDGTVSKLFNCIQPKTDTNSNGFLFDRNTYINTTGNGFGTLPVTFPNYSGIYGASEKLISYEYGKLKDLVSHGFETNGKFYYSSSDQNSDAALKGICCEFESKIDQLPLYTYTAANGTVLPFRLVLPEGYSESSSYPLIVYLNTEQASGTDNIKQTTVANTMMAKIVAEGKSILLIPQSPEKSWTGVKTSNGNYLTSEYEESKIMGAVAGLINDVAKKYHASKNFAIGVDAGAYAVSDLLVRHKNLLQKAVIISGAGDSSAKIGKAEAWIIHAKYDETVPFENAQELANAWGAELTEYPRGYLHDCWNDVFIKEDIISWLQ